MFLTINNTKIHYIKKGKGQPLIFLHGIFLDTSVYKEFIDILSSNFKVYAVDLPFHGKSGNIKGEVSVNSYYLILKGFISKLKIKNPVILASSAGALPAIVY